MYAVSTEARPPCPTATATSRTPAMFRGRVDRACSIACRRYSGLALNSLSTTCKTGPTTLLRLMAPSRRSSSANSSAVAGRASPIAASIASLRVRRERGDSPAERFSHRDAHDWGGLRLGHARLHSTRMPSPSDNQSAGLRAPPASHLMRIRPDGTEVMRMGHASGARTPGEASSPGC